jgi:hypothetical protein
MLANSFGTPVSTKLRRQQSKKFAKSENENYPTYSQWARNESSLDGAMHAFFSHTAVTKSIMTR